MDIKQIAKQFAGFTAIGFLAFFIDYVLLLIFSQAFLWHPLLSAFLSYVLATVFNYFASKRYVFHFRTDISKSRSFILFITFSLIGLLFNEIIMFVGFKLLGSGALAVSISKLISSFIVSIWNFASRRKWLDDSE